MPEPGRAAKRVIGYYAICPTLVVREDIPKLLAPRHAPRDTRLAAGKLALDVSRRGANDRHWRARLLLDAMETIAASADAGRGQAIVVDADKTPAF